MKKIKYTYYYGTVSQLLYRCGENRLEFFDLEGKWCPSLCYVKDGKPPTPLSMWRRLTRNQARKEYPQAFKREKAKNLN